jgi:hypothetical protein
MAATRARLLTPGPELQAMRDTDPDRPTGIAAGR